MWMSGINVGLIHSHAKIQKLGSTVNVNQTMAISPLRSVCLEPSWFQERHDVHDQDPEKERVLANNKLT
jgi:hypothetical protein